MINSEQTQEESLQREQKRTAPIIKETVQKLLKHGFIEHDQSKETNHLYQICKNSKEQINQLLEPLDLCLQIDENRGLLVLKILQRPTTEEQMEEAWQHPLVKRQRLTLEQSLLVALLRRYYLIQEQEKGTGTQSVRLYFPDLIHDAIVLIGDSGSDQKNERHVLKLIDQLKAHGIVSNPDQNNELIIRPLIVHFADPESLTVLLEQYKAVTAE